MTKNTVDFDNDDEDFGFSFADNEIENLSKKNIEDAEKLEKIFSLMMKFLDNLSQNPEKKTLLWPDRVAKIKLFKEKLIKIKEGDI